MVVVGVVVVVAVGVGDVVGVVVGVVVVVGVGVGVGVVVAVGVAVGVAVAVADVVADVVAHVVVVADEVADVVVTSRTPSQIGRSNRRGGKETERKVRDYLRTWWPELDYTHPGGPNRVHTDDRGDLGPLVDRDRDHWTVEVKGWRETQSAGVIDRACREAEAEAEAAGMGGLWVLIVRRPGCADVARWHAWVPAGTLFDLVGSFNADLVCLTVRTWVTLTAPEPF